MSGELRTSIGETGPDRAWDAFVAAVPGGGHVQTSMWAEVKAVVGWGSERVVLRRGDEIVAGCQLLTRRAGPATLAYAPHGPLAAPGERDALPAVLAGLRELAGRHRLCYLKVQPPPGTDAVGGLLTARGYSRSDLEAAPTATTRVDLAPEPDELLARMRSGTRANIRKAQRRGATTRTAGTEDFQAFSGLVLASGRRQGFVPYPLAYYRRMLEAFATGADATLVLCEHEERLVSSLLVVAFGDSAIYKMGGWVGGELSVRPNELMHWTAMQWARERGYRRYDFDGMPPQAARAALAGEEFDRARWGTAWFKLGFGGEVALHPPAYDTSPSPLLAPVVRGVAPRLGRYRPMAERALGRGSTRAEPEGEPASAASCSAPSLHSSPAP